MGRLSARVNATVAMAQNQRLTAQADWRTNATPGTRLDMALLLEISNVTKTFAGPNAKPVLQDVSLGLGAGETLALTGESGSGKSTLLHLAGALDSFDSGEITLAGTPLSSLGDTGRAALRRDCVALVFQQFNLIPSLTVAQNLSFHARLGGTGDPDWTATLTQRLGLSDLTERYPEQLSGGQQQRVAIGRAMALRPRLLLADEPTGNLDRDSGDVVLDLMLELVAETGAALLLVTHSTRIAARLGRRAHLSAGRIT
jgi:putative ABC transport system ATP-binding protein